jgi:hypothetical protein
LLALGLAFGDEHCGIPYSVRRFLRFAQVSLPAAASARGVRQVLWAAGLIASVQIW